MLKNGYGYEGKLPHAAPNQNTDLLLQNLLLETAQTPPKSESETPDIPSEDAEDTSPLSELAALSRMRLSECPDTVSDPPAQNRKSLSNSTRSPMPNGMHWLDRKA